MARALPRGARQGHGVPMGCTARLAQPRCPHAAQGTAGIARASPQAQQGQGTAEGPEGVRGGSQLGRAPPAAPARSGDFHPNAWPGSGSAALLWGRGRRGRRGRGDAGTQGRRDAGMRAVPAAAGRRGTAPVQPHAGHEQHCSLRHRGHGQATHAAPRCCFTLHQTWLRRWGWGRGDVGTPCRCWWQGQPRAHCPFSSCTAQRRARHRPGDRSTHFPQRGSLAKKIADSGQPESFVGQK